MSMTGPQSAEQFFRSLGKRVERLEMRPFRAPRPFAGATADRPDPTLVDVGAVFFDTDLGGPVFNSGTAWVASPAVVPPPLSGATATRPAAASVTIGTPFFDTTIGKPSWSTGAAWVLADGTVVP